MRLYPGNKPELMRAHLGSFGLSGDLALQRIGTLSGGQKSRVSLAVLSWKKPHIIIAVSVGSASLPPLPCSSPTGASFPFDTQDEITNFLDIETIDSLIVAFGNFPGGVIAVRTQGCCVRGFTPARHLLVPLLASLQVSHDQHFVQSFAEEIWVVGEGAVRRFRGDFSAYRRVAAGERPMTSDVI